MQFRINSNDLGRMLRIVNKVVPPKQGLTSNIEIAETEENISIRACNGAQHVRVLSPIMGGENDSFCVDGKMMENIISKCNGTVDISSDDKSCTIRNAGRMKIPTVNVKIQNISIENGKTATVPCGEFARCVNSVFYAVSTDQNRPVLTGILMEIGDGTLRMVSLDGFQMAMEEAKCEGESMKIVVPGTVAKMVCDCSGSDDTLEIFSDGYKVAFRTPDVEIVTTLLADDFPDWNRILPKSFTTEALFNAADMQSCLKMADIAADDSHLVKTSVTADKITVSSRSEEADFTQDVGCSSTGNELNIAFNIKYLLNALNVIGTEEATVHMNSSVSPAVVTEKDGKGAHLVLPVRV